MAYKFQLGLARMSGALEQEGDVVVSTGSSDVIGIVNVHGASDYFAQMKYDGSSNIESAVLELLSGSQATSFYAGEKLSGSVMDTLAGTALEFDQNSGVMDFNIDGLSALGGASLHQTEDHFVFSDNGTEKKITFSNLEDSIFGNVSQSRSRGHFISS